MSVICSQATVSQRKQHPVWWTDIVVMAGSLGACLPGLMGVVILEQEHLWVRTLAIHTHPGKHGGSHSGPDTATKIWWPDSTPHISVISSLCDSSMSCELIGQIGVV